MAYTIISTLPMFVALFWAAVLLIDKKRSNLSKRFLAFFLGLSTINYFTHALYFNHKYELYAVFDSIWCFTSLAGYPLFYYYIRLLTNDTALRWKWLWLVVPSFLLAAFSAAAYILMSPAEVHTFIHSVMYHEPNAAAEPYPPLVQLQHLRLVLFKVIFVPQVILAFYFGLKLILAYNKRIKDFYSNTRGKDLTPIKWLLIFFIFASFISMLSSLIGKDFFVTHSWLLVVPSLTHSLYLFGIGYFGSKQDFTIEDFQEVLSRSEDLDVSEEVEAEEISLFVKSTEGQRVQLVKLLEEGEIFTNPELRITDLASMLNTNRTYASRLFQETFHASFADTINRFRVRKSLSLMTSDSAARLSLEDIFIRSGFASESSFYRAFKKETGVSPGKFRKSSTL